MYWYYQQPVCIHFGQGVLRKLPEVARSLGGKKGLLVTSKSFVRSGASARILQESEGLLAAVFGQVSPNPDVKECDACAALLRQGHCDFVVALGGGSVMDSAKAAATLCLTDDPAARYLGTGEVLPQAHLPLIAIPTTAGTGSEITCVSVLSDHSRGLKSPMSSDGFYPAVALVDPELTYSVPPYLTACTGMDVLCHAIEAYWSRHHQPVCDALAVHAARLVFEYLPVAYAEGRDAEAREKMCEASVVAGLAFTLPKTTSAHACSYPLTNLLGIPHGEACGLTIDYFIRQNAELGCARVHELARLLGYADAGALADAVGALKTALHLRTDLHDLHLSEAQQAQLVQGSKHPNLLNNPVEITESMLRRLYSGLC